MFPYLVLIGNFYNNFRVLEVIILLILYFYSIFNDKIIFSKIDFIYFILIIQGVFYWRNSYFIIIDLLVFYLLYKAFLILEYNRLVSIFIIIISLLIFLLLPVSILEYINLGIYKNWYPLPWNIRFYDSYFLIFTIFAVWFYLTEKKYINIYLLFLFLAFLSMLMDGGRSVALSYSIFIITICIFNSKARWSLFTVYIMTWLTYLLISYFTSLTYFDVKLVRESSSGRYELWSNAYKHWLEHPIIGSGFYQLDSYQNLSAHPHNLFIQILTETGLVGFLFFSFIIIIIIKNIDWNLKKNYFLLAALGAIGIDLSFSGAYIYPVTQIALLWLFVFLLKNPDFSHAFYFGNLTSKNLIKNKNINFILFYFLVFIFLYIFLNMYILSEKLPLAPPRFWEYGYQLF